MVIRDNLIVESHCFIPLKFQHKTTDEIKHAITNFMVHKMYQPENPDDFFINNKFYSMNYLLQLSYPEVPVLTNLKKKLGLISEKQLFKIQYDSALNYTRDDYPYKINFLILNSTINGEDGYKIKIRSEPVILFKMRQLGNKPIFNNFIFSDIIGTNKDFLNDIMTGLGTRIIKKPRALNEFFKTPIIEKLEISGFKNIADLLQNGILKIERGDIEDGLTDLRSSLEIFVKKVVEKIEKEPFEQHKIKDNLNILKTEGYLDENMMKLIHNTLYSWLYHYLSDKSVHKREKINLIDAEFLFSLGEEIIDYLLKRIIIYRY